MSETWLSFLELKQRVRSAALYFRDVLLLITTSIRCVFAAYLIL